MAENPIDRLKSQLLTSGLSQENSPLYQIINQLIDAMRDVIVSTGTGSGGGGGLTTQTFLTYALEQATLPNSRQLVAGPGISFNRTNTNLVISASMNQLKQLIDETNRGPRGFPGDRGPAGPIGPIGPRGLAGIGNDSAMAQLPRPLWNDTNITTITNTGTVNDLDIQQADVVLCNNASDLTITGIVGGKRGQRVKFFSINTGGHVFFTHQDAASAANNRLMNFASVGVTPLSGSRGSCSYVYDMVTARWRLLYHNQGIFITPTFNAADYTANGGGGAWTVAAGDVAAISYFLKNRELTVLVVLNTTTTVGAANTELRRIIPGGYTCATESITANLRVFAGAAWQIGFFYGQAGSTLMRFFYDLTGAANWPAVADNAYVQGTCVFQIQ